MACHVCGRHGHFARECGKVEVATCTLFIRNLTSDYENEHVPFFRALRGFVDARVRKDRNNSSVSFIDFESPDTALHAKQLGEGRGLSVQFASSSTKDPQRVGAAASAAGVPKRRREDEYGGGGGPGGGGAGCWGGGGAESYGAMHGAMGMGMGGADGGVYGGQYPMGGMGMAAGPGLGPPGMGSGMAAAGMPLPGMGPGMGGPGMGHMGHMGNMAPMMGGGLTGGVHGMGGGTGGRAMPSSCVGAGIAAAAAAAARSCGIDAHSGRRGDSTNAYPGMPVLPPLPPSNGLANPPGSPACQGGYLEYPGGLAPGGAAQAQAAITVRALSPQSARVGREARRERPLCAHSEAS
jgi:hypothetical protein